MKVTLKKKLREGFGSKRLNEGNSSLIHQKFGMKFEDLFDQYLEELANSSEMNDQSFERIASQSQQLLQHCLKLMEKIK